jgi:cell division protein ZapB
MDTKEPTGPEQDTREESKPQTEASATPDPEPKKSKRLPILIVISFVLIAVLLFFFIQNQQLKKEVETGQKELNQTVLQLDSISNELDNKIIEIQQLGGDIDTLLLVKKELEEEKRKLLSSDRANRSTITRLREKVAGYEELLVMKDEEIKVLKKQNEVLLNENTVLKTEKNQLADSITNLAENTDKLSEKVALASRLKASGVRIFAVNRRSKEREGEFRNRHIEQLRIAFRVEENPVAPVEGKELLIRIIAPDKNVLFDVTRGSGSFTFEGREMFYTAKKEILYDKTAQQISLFYDKGSGYAEGKYDVEIYTDEYLMGRGSFIVK